MKKCPQDHISNSCTDDLVITTNQPKPAVAGLGLGPMHWTRREDDTWPKMGTCHYGDRSSATGHWTQSLPTLANNKAH